MCVLLVWLVASSYTVAQDTSSIRYNHEISGLGFGIQDFQIAYRYSGLQLRPSVFLGVLFTKPSKRNTKFRFRHGVKVGRQVSNDGREDWSGIIGYNLSNTQRISQFFEIRTGFERYGNPKQYGGYIFGNFVTRTNDIVFEGEVLRWDDLNQPANTTSIEIDKFKDLGIGLTSGVGIRIPINAKVNFRKESGIGVMVYERKIEAFVIDWGSTTNHEVTIVKPSFDLIHGVSIGYNFN